MQVSEYCICIIELFSFAISHTQSVTSRQEGESSSSKEPSYIRHIGAQFTDTDEGILFVIDDVVERADDKMIFFKYHELRDQEIVAAAPRTTYEYTPCNELLSADWVKWSEMSLK